MPVVDFAVEILKWVERASLSVFIRESAWAFPTIESVHVIAIALVVGTISIADIRLLGLASTKRGFTELCSEVLPWTWSAFTVAVVAGLLMFISHATEYFDNTAFRIKLVVILLAGLNMIYFNVFTGRDVSEWGRSSAVPLGGRIAGGLSLALWIAVVGCGRWVGFTMPL
jgi:hypothetical protein